MKNVKHFFILGLLFAMLSCSSDDDDNTTEEISIEEQIENFVTPDLLAALEELGFIFRDGEEFPELTGNYLMSPVTLASSNIMDEAFEIGDPFNEVSLNFLSQDNEARTLEIEISESGTIDVPTETFFSGFGNQFSAYVKSNQTISNVDLVILRAFSGVITEAGFIDFQSALLVLEKGEDPDGELIEEGEGRLFVDEDNLVESILGRNQLNTTNASGLNTLQTKPNK